MTIAAWLLVAAGLVLVSRVFPAPDTTNLSAPGSESDTVFAVLEAEFPQVRDVSAQVVFHDESAPVIEAQPAIREALQNVAELEGVTSVVDPTSESGAAQVSRDGRTAYATVEYALGISDVTPETVAELMLALAPARDAGLQVEVGGTVGGLAQRPDTGGSEIIGLVAAVVVLLVAFGTLVAMALPIVTALIGLAVGLAAGALLGHVIDMPAEASILATMIGLGVGIDYALFVVTRFRQQRAQGASIPDAVGASNATAGLAVVFAGGTVVIAILGLSVAGLPFVTALGVAGAVVVAVAVMAAVTLLPAVLGALGAHIDRLKAPGLRIHSEAAESPVWSRLARRIGSRPWPYAIAATLLLVVLGIPTLSMRLGQPDFSVDQPDSTASKAFTLISEGFGPGFNGPLLLAARLSPPAAPPDPTAPADPADTDPRLTEIMRALQSTDGVVAVAPPFVSQNGNAALLTVIPTTGPAEEETEQLIETIRRDVLPRATSSEAQVFVGGRTAAFIDVSERISQRLPWFIVAVVGLSFLLLMLVFRSILVPLKAALLNILSILAAYGVVVAVFQWGWLKDVVGLEQTVPIVSFVPMVMFAILFGLSMDYEVFLLSRVREEYLSTGNNLGSVERGLSTTARVITSAALIMIAVFGSFVLGDSTLIKMMGVGLATAILVDATVVRLILVPATMALLGDANWWLPRWMDRLLPQIHLEGTAPPADPVTPDPQIAVEQVER